MDGHGARLPEAPLVARLDSALRSTVLPERYPWLWTDSSGLEPRACPDPIFEALRRAARRGGEAAGERRYAWWMAADRRAAEDCNRWFRLSADTVAWIQERRRALGELGLNYVYAELGAVWVYDHSLLRRVWMEAPETRWGHFAFARLQEMGWDPTGTCATGSEQFPAVIRKGERFLADREPTPFLRAFVETTVGAAYETKWSISQTRSDDMGVFDYPFGPDTPPELKEKAAAAARALVEGDGELERRRALRLYRAVAESDSAGPELRAYADAKVRRLEARENTHQYRYYCIYD